MKELRRMGLGLSKRVLAKRKLAERKEEQKRLFFPQPYNEEHVTGQYFTQPTKQLRKITARIWQP